MFNACARGRLARRALRAAGAAGLVVACSAGAAQAALTAPEEGAVFRGGSVPINENVGAQFYKADGVTPMSSLERAACVARSSSNPNGRTARTLVTVVRASDDTVVFQAEKPNNLTGILAQLGNDQSGPFATSWAIPEDARAGQYRVVSIAENRRRVSSSNPCQLEIVLRDVKTIEYRPWQHVFKDVFGGGRVSMNLSPAEFQAAVNGQEGQIRSGAGVMTAYQLPGGSGYALPADPAACAADPASCVPSTAVVCKPQDSACSPRVVVISASGGTLRGVFDLETKAFIAIASVNGHQRVLVSLGTENDAAYQALLPQLAAAAAAQGIDLMSLLATKVRVRNGSGELSLSLLNGLQIQPRQAPGGVQIVSDATAQAGIVLNVFAALAGQPCTARSADSDPASPAPDRFTPQLDVGYTVQRAEILPSVPRIGPLGALAGGPLYHIEGDFVGNATTVANTSTAVIGVDTAADEPNGYPVWIQPFLSTPLHVTAAREMDFVGTATWTASETPLGSSCLSVNFLLGAGAAIYNNPLPVGFGDLPVWDPASPEVRALVGAVDEAVQGAVDAVTSDPTVDSLLEQLLGALPPIT